MTAPRPRTRHLLRIDGTAGLAAGVVVLVAHAFLAPLYAMPVWLIVVNGVANLVYGTFSTTLANRAERPAALITLLVVANLSWALVCVGVVVATRDTATWFGIAHFAFEAAFVGGLGVLEWRARASLRWRSNARDGEM